MDTNIYRNAVKVLEDEYRKVAGFDGVFIDRFQVLDTEDKIKHVFGVDFVVNKIGCALMLSVVSAEPELNGAGRWLDTIRITCKLYVPFRESDSYEGSSVERFEDLVHEVKTKFDSTYSSTTAGGEYFEIAQVGQIEFEGASEFGITMIEANGQLVHCANYEHSILIQGET